MRLLAAFLTCAAALLLPSCFTWHTADSIRESYITHTGVDIFHPVDGTIYHEREHSLVTRKWEKNGTSYVIAPEITYTESPSDLRSIIDKPEFPSLPTSAPRGGPSSPASVTADTSTASWRSSLRAS